MVPSTQQLKFTITVMQIVSSWMISKRESNLHSNYAGYFSSVVDKVYYPDGETALRDFEIITSRFSNSPLWNAKLISSGSQFKTIEIEWVGDFSVIYDKTKSA